MRLNIHATPAVSRGVKPSVVLTYLALISVLGAGCDKRDQVQAPAKEAEQSERAASAAAQDDDERIHEAGFIQAPMVTEVLPAYEKLIEKNLIIPNSVHDGVTMTINTGERMTRAVAIRFYEDTFLINGFAVLPVDEWTVKLVDMNPRQEAFQQIYRRAEAIPDVDETLGYIMRLKHISADDAVKFLQQHCDSEFKYIPAPDGATVILTASGSVLRTLVELKEQIDIPASPASLDSD